MVAYLMIAATVLAASPAHSTDFRPVRQIQRACRADSVTRPKVTGILLRRSGGTSGDLPFVEAKSTATGSIVRIYYEVGLAGAAEAKIACFSAVLDRLKQKIPDPRPNVHWSAIVLTHDKQYIPPRDLDEARWPVTLKGNAWDRESLNFLLVTMPHEETHFSQARDHAPHLPRWFQEGHAEWAALQAIEPLFPKLAAAERARFSSAMNAQPHTHLGAWGGMKIKPEAFERQLSAEDRARRASDPSYVPKGPFRFGPGDFYEEKVGFEARYGAALKLFEDLTGRHGAAAVRTWVSAVLQSSTPDAPIELAKTILDEDLSPRLR